MNACTFNITTPLLNFYSNKLSCQRSLETTYVGRRLFWSAYNASGGHSAHAWNYQTARFW